MYPYVSGEKLRALRSKASGALHQTLVAYARTDAKNEERSVKVSFWRKITNFL